MNQAFSITPAFNSDDQSAPLPPDWAIRTLRFWFDGRSDADWFGGGADFDALVREALGPLREAVRALPVDALLVDAQHALAAIILFDQVPRNSHRGSAEAFATDDAALAIARQAVDRGYDAGLAVPERLFLYLPFEHSEELDDQREAVRLIGTLDHPGYLDFALRHFDVIKTWGRFPGRNAALGRADRPGEAAAVAAGAGF